MDGLLMKYFVLNPTKDDEYGYASMNALSEYAFCIKDVNPQLSKDIGKWLSELLAKRKGVGE